MRHSTAVAAGLVVFALSLAISIRSALAAAPPLDIQSSRGGRWQIVNGTPTMTRNIMLLDTATGDSFITCATPAGDGWCHMARFKGGTVPVADEVPPGQK